MLLDNNKRIILSRKELLELVTEVAQKKDLIKVNERLIEMTHIYNEATVQQEVHFVAAKAVEVTK